MKRTKKQNGITLLALIVTVVLLLILASVAISNISEDGIISQAGDAKDQTGEFISSTTQQHQDYVDYLKGELGGLGSANCSHDSVYENYTHDFSSYDHITETKCAKCNMVLSTNTVNNYRVSYSHAGSSEQHQLEIRCSECNFLLDEPWENHTLIATGSGAKKCTLCDYLENCEHDWEKSSEYKIDKMPDGSLGEYCYQTKYKYYCTKRMWYRKMGV